jgi:spore maturation protein CgeB
LEDFRRSGCASVSYLPFAYDPELSFPEDAGIDQSMRFDILFVGGAEHDRVSVLTEIISSGLQVALYGDHWERYGVLRQYHYGRANEAMLRLLTARAPINLCLCRRANRDGHVMRSLEIPAIGGFMLAEDTGEHRELFGEEGECVLYFANARQAIEKANWVLQRPHERQRMSAAAHDRIVSGPNTYGDRLNQILNPSFMC